jgi:lipopolysaccharide assembly LptE-like protein
MQFKGFLRRSGISSLVALAIGFSTSGCHYGFAGGGLPSHVKTMAIQPFDNETPSPEVQRELLEVMHRELQRRLGVRDAPESRSDAVVKGVIRSYDADVPVAYSADRTQSVTARRLLRITLDIQIVDQTTNKLIWEKRGLSAEGDYAERDEAGGRREALKRIVNDIVEGAQSQW